MSVYNHKRLTRVVQAGIKPQDPLKQTLYARPYMMRALPAVFASPVSFTVRLPYTASAAASTVEQIASILVIPCVSTTRKVYFQVPWLPVCVRVRVRSDRAWTGN